MAASPQGGPPEVPKKTEKVLQMSKVLNPDALAPGKCHLQPKANTTVVSVMWGSWSLPRGPPQNPPLEILIYKYIKHILMLYTYVILPPAAGPPWPCEGRAAPSLPSPARDVAPAQRWPPKPIPSLPHTGYSGPLKEVPPEKFNVTAIPKGYRSPWQELLGDKDNAVHGKNQPPVRPSPWDFRSFNR